VEQTLTQDFSLYIAFEGTRKLAAGSLHEVALAAKAAHDSASRTALLVFDAAGRTIELDLRGDSSAVSERYSPTQVATPPLAAPEPAPAGPGRPKLGVVAREVTLLPRHWDWLNDQSGGASVALRKLVDEARRVNADKDAKRHAQEAAYRFLTVIAGDLTGFEEASRALFAGDPIRFDESMSTWPADVRDHARTLSAPALLLRT